MQLVAYFFFPQRGVYDLVCLVLESFVLLGDRVLASSAACGFSFVIRNED